MRSLKVEDTETRRHFIEAKRAGHGGCGSRQTALTLAQSTGRTDRHRCRTERLAIDDLIAMGDIAADEKCCAAHPFAKVRLRAFDAARYRQKPRTIRHLRRL